MRKKRLNQLGKFESALSRQAKRIVESKVPIELRILNQLKVALSNPQKKLAEVEKTNRVACDHQLTFEIARRRVEDSPGTKVLPPTRVCLVCWTTEDATQKRNSKKKFSSTFSRLTAKPIGVVRRNYSAITISFGKQPITEYVKAILAAKQFGDKAIERIIYPNLYGSPKALPLRKRLSR